MTRIPRFVLNFTNHHFTKTFFLSFVLKGAWSTSQRSNEIGRDFSQHTASARITATNARRKIGHATSSSDTCYGGRHPAGADSGRVPPSRAAGRRPRPKSSADRLGRRLRLGGLFDVCGILIGTGLRVSVDIFVDMCVWIRVILELLRASCGSRVLGG